LDYLEWVELVAKTFADNERGLDRILGVRELATLLGLVDEGQPVPGDVLEAIHYAVEDLDALGIVDRESDHWIKPTQATRQIRHGTPLRMVWPQLLDDYITPEQRQLLLAIAVRSARRTDTYANADWVEMAAVYEQLGWSPSDHEPYGLVQQLADQGWIGPHITMGGIESIQARITYRGLVRITQEQAGAWQVELDGLVKEWETVTVEFKRVIRLGTDKLNAEFARDASALANTKASGGERRLVLGFDSQSREFTAPIEPTITQDRLEQILDAYVKPMPDVTLVTFDHESGKGSVGVLAVHRDPTKVPYRIRKGGGKVQANDVYVRHGTHVVKPDSQELADLEAEGRRARGE
jgi:Schlafen, AlbA_2